MYPPEFLPMEIQGKFWEIEVPKFDIRINYEYNFAAIYSFLLEGLLSSLRLSTSGFPWSCALKQEKIMIQMMF